MARPTVLKLGGELLGDGPRTQAVAAEIARAAAAGPLAVVHGGGREIDAALEKAGIPKQQVEGVRITDEPTLDIVVSVLAGAINTRFVAAINAAGGRAVGLTGADCSVGPVEPMPLLRTVAGDMVWLGLVGEPIHEGAPHLVAHLLGGGYVPVVATIGAGADGAVYNVNADTMAAALAVRLGASRLLVAGTTPGVLDEAGRTIARLAAEAEQQLADAGIVNRGMVAKLRACRAALSGGVPEVAVVDGSYAGRLRAALAGSSDAAGSMTRVI